MATENILPQTTEQSTLRGQGHGIGGPGGTMARRRYQMGTLRLRGKRRKVWTLRWREDVVVADGHVRRINKETVLGTQSEIPTQKLARRRADVLLARINRPDYRPGKVIGFEEFAERWMEHALSQQKPSSQKVSRSHLRFHLIARFGRLRLDQIGQEDVQQFVSAIAKRLSRHTILNILGTLFSILGTAKQWGYVVNEVHGSDLAIPNTRPSRIAATFTGQQLSDILAKAEQPWYTIFAVAALSGLRPGEVLGLSVDDLDFENRQIFVRRAAWQSRLVVPKSQSSMKPVVMAGELEPILKQYLMDWRPNPKRLLFVNRRGNPYSRNKLVHYRLWPILDALGIPRCGMHAFRHSAASWLVAKGISLKVVQAQLRHADARITLERYSHIIGDEQREAMDSFAHEILRGNARKFPSNPSYIN